MSILKKITDKYGFLRFLNKKTTKLCILSAALVGLCLSSGYSFAKYRDENYGGGNAGAAKFNYGKITYTPATIKQPKTLDNIQSGYHLFACEFQYEVPVTEVSFLYSIKLRLVARSISSFTVSNSGLTKTSFSCSQDSDSFWAFDYNTNRAGEDEFTTVETSIAAVTNDELTYSPGHWFYAKGSSKNNLTWDDSNEYVENTNNEVIEIDSGKVEAGTSLTVYYVVIIFVYADVQQVGGNNKEKKWEAESSNLLYSIDAIQEEVEDEKN